MPRPKIPNCGWAAFDRKQGVEASKSEHERDAFPSLSNITSPGHVGSMTSDNLTTIKSFSSVIRPSLDFNQLSASGRNRTMDEKSGTKDPKCQAIAETNKKHALKLLKDIHVWADENLIEDVLAAVNDDTDQASMLLKAMISPSSKSSGHASVSTPSSYEDSDGMVKPFEIDNSFGSKAVNGTHEIMIKKRLIAVPDEPEWEEDDIYLSHRKDAMKMIRVASQHSKAASNAFLRGEHALAHQLSLRSRSEWMAAEDLNNKAAEEILRTRNSSNDIWKIDLHGLHAGEAVDALKNRLCIVESKLMVNQDRSNSSDGLTQQEIEILPSLSTQRIMMSDSNSKMKNLVPQRRQKVLEVITGIGTHSKGQAALPVAIRSFLIDSGYRFDDSRPGIFAVHPKFRY